MIRRKAIVAAVIVGLFVIISFMTYLNSQTVFYGSSIKNHDVYIMDIERMNGTDLYSMEFEENDEVSVNFESEKGEMYLKITGPDGKAVYEGNGKGINLFTLNIKESGVYSIGLEAENARGYLNIHLKK
ncbi:MAG: hypothetical protein ACI4WM_08180 [Erysipelotrichaceae bacterium]